MIASSSGRSAILEVVQTEKPNIGCVVRVGPLAKGVLPGDRIRFGTGEGYLSYTEFEENGERLLVMQEADVCFIEQ